MRKSNKLGVLGATALALSLGCANLTVTVDLYVGDAVLRNQLTEQVAAIDKSGLCREGQTQKQLETLLAGIEKPWRAAASDIGGEPTAINTEWAALKAIISKSWTEYTKSVEDVCAAKDQLWKVLTKSSPKTRNQPLSVLSAVLNEAQFNASNAYRAIADAIGADEEGWAGVRAQVLGAEPIAFSATAIASNDVTRGRVAGFPVFDANVKHLLSDEPTPSEENAGISRWKTMNKVRATANGGNSQFVLVQHGLMVFHQKSLDFDPSQVIALVAGAARTGLQVASTVAGAAGVPIPVSFDGGTSTPASAESDGIPSPESIAHVDSVVEGRQKAIDRCMLDLSNFLHANDKLGEKEVEAKVEAKNIELEKLIRKCQGDIDEVARP